MELTKSKACTVLHYCCVTHALSFLPGGFPSSLLAVHLDSAQHFPPWLNKEAVFAGSEAEVKQWAKPAPIQLKETPVNPHLESLRSIGSFSQT